MDKNGIKKAIKDIIASSPELEADYDILLKDKIGYMKSKIYEHCDEIDKYTADFIRYFIAVSKENTRTTYANILNSRVKLKLEERLDVKIVDEEFLKIMLEVVDDMANEVR